MRPPGESSICSAWITAEHHAEEGATVPVSVQRVGASSPPHTQCASWAHSTALCQDRPRGAGLCAAGCHGAGWPEREAGALQGPAEPHAARPHATQPGATSASRGRLHSHRNSRRQPTLQSRGLGRAAAATVSLWHARCSLPQLRTKTHQAPGSLWPPCCPLRPPPPPWGTRTGSLTLQRKDIFTHAAYSSLKKKSFEERLSSNLYQNRESQ